MLSKSVSIFITLQNSPAASSKKLTIIGLEPKGNTIGKNLPNQIRFEFNKFYVVGSPTDQTCSGVGSEHCPLKDQRTFTYSMYLPAKVLLMPKNDEQVDFNCNKLVEVLYLYDQNMHSQQFYNVFQYLTQIKQMFNHC